MAVREVEAMRTVRITVCDWCDEVLMDAEGNMKAHLVVDVRPYLNATQLGHLQSMPMKLHQFCDAECLAGYAKHRADEGLPW